jgi:hypothetical protein
MISYFITGYFALHFFIGAMITDSTIHLTISLISLFYFLVLIPAKHRHDENENKNGGAE